MANAGWKAQKSAAGRGIVSVILMEDWAVGVARVVYRAKEGARWALLRTK